MRFHSKTYGSNSGRLNVFAKFAVIFDAPYCSHRFDILNLSPSPVASQAMFIGLFLFPDSLNELFFCLFRIQWRKWNINSLCVRDFNQRFQGKFCESLFQAQTRRTFDVFLCQYSHYFSRRKHWRFFLLCRFNSLKEKLCKFRSFRLLPEFIFGNLCFFAKLS